MLTPERIPFIAYVVHGKCSLGGNLRVDRLADTASVGSERAHHFPGSRWRAWYGERFCQCRCLCWLLPSYVPEKLFNLVTWLPETFLLFSALQRHPCAGSLGHPFAKSLLF